MTKPKKSRKPGSKRSRDYAARSKNFSEGVGGPDEPPKPGIGNYPRHLKGLATNRHGGNQLQRERGFKGNTYGPAGPVRVYSEEERRKYENELRGRGDLQ
ncbi:hypothetical protein [Bradyrhizobium barranii]